MHFVEVQHSRHLGSPGVEGTKRAAFIRQVISTVVDATDPTERGGFHGRLLESRLRDPAFRAEYKRVEAEFEQLAPAAEGPVVNPGRTRRGRLLFGDANE